MRRTRIISGIVAFMMATTPFAGVKSGKTVSEKEAAGGVKTVTVGEGGDYATIEAARDYIRTLDKSKYEGITVEISGEYAVKDAIEFTEEDAGTADCPITYTGKDGATLSGGLVIPAADFVPASGETAEYFSKEARANIVMTDLSDDGFGKDYVEAKLKNLTLNGETILPLYQNGTLLTPCRYPNEGYTLFTSGERVLVDENAEMPEKYVVVCGIDEETSAHIATWHDLSTVYTVGHHTYLWRQNNFKLLSADCENSTITMPYPYSWDTLGYVPIAGRPLYYINIPEELDMPGEYYLDKDGMLYVYKTDDFASSSFTVPQSECAIRVTGGDYITLDNLTVIGFSKKAITVDANHFAVTNCEICAAEGAIVMNGSDNLVENCNIHDIQFTAVSVSGGDCTSLTSANTLITQNIIHDWGQVVPMYEPAVKITAGCGITVSHNEIYNGGHTALTWEGNNHVVEYNHIHDVCRMTDDAGAIYAYNSYAHYGNVFRYNYIHDVGLVDEDLKNLENYPYCNVSAIYFDGGKSGQTAIGNVIMNVSGTGVIASGRDTVVTNNLFISCGYAVDMSAWYYNAKFNLENGEDGGGKNHQNFAGQENNTVWQKAFPSLYQLTWEDGDENDPNYYIAPAGNVLKNNYIFYDKANMPSLKSYGHAYSHLVNDAVRKFCGDNIEEFAEGVNQTTYTSKRTPITAEEAIEKTSSVTGITLEIFAEIGRNQ